MKRYIIMFIIILQVFFISMLSIQQYKENNQKITTVKSEVINNEKLAKNSNGILVYRYGLNEYVYIDKETSYSYDITNEKSKKQIDEYISWHDNNIRFWIIKIIAILIFGFCLIIIV